MIRDNWRRRDDDVNEDDNDAVDADADDAVDDVNTIGDDTIGDGDNIDNNKEWWWRQKQLKESISSRYSLNPLSLRDNTLEQWTFIL